MSKLQCGMRLYDKKTRSEMTCTLERGHEKPVHEMFINEKWLGGWVDHGEPVYGGDFGGHVQRHPLDLPPPPKVPKVRKARSTTNPHQASLLVQGEGEKT